MKKKILLLLIAISPSLGFAQQISMQDSLALVDLYTSTDGANWTSNTNWITGALDTWSGVTLDFSSPRRVLRLNLSDAGLNGTLPESLGDLSGAETISIKNNENLTGPIPSSIGNLTGAEIIDLSGNNLSGEIPTSIANLITLERFSANGNQLSGNIPAALFGLSFLTNINLSDNNFTGTIPEFTNLPDLRDLRLANNNLEGDVPNSFTSLFSLRNLFLEGNELTGFPDVSVMFNNWGRFYLDDNKFHFDDLPDSALIGNSYRYAPQKNALDTGSIIVPPTDYFSISAIIGGTDNQYQWFKDGIILEDSTDAEFGVAIADPVLHDGVYTCEITNPNFPELTITRNPVTVEVRLITSLILQAKEMGIRLFPNPIANGNFSISTEKKLVNAQLQIHNLQGAVVFSEGLGTLESGAVKQLSIGDDLAKGVYVATLQAEENLISIPVLVN